MDNIKQYLSILIGEKQPSSVTVEDTSSPPPPPKKRGRKTNEDQEAHDYMVKHIALAFFMDSECRTVHFLCKSRDMEFIRYSLTRLILSEPRLKHISQGERRKDRTLVDEAVQIIERRYPPKKDETEVAEEEVSNEEEAPDETEGVQVQQVIDGWVPTLTIFDFYHLQEIVGDLDWNNPNRMSRDGTKSIPIHNRKRPSETVKFLIFDLAGRVINHSNLGVKMRKKPLLLAAKLLMYDHGHKEVKGISNLNKT